MNSNVLMGMRILFGIFLLVFGVNKFANFLEFPPIPGDGGELMRIYFVSGFMKLIGILEIVCGLLLLAGRFVPLALTIGGAIMFNALVFHLLHAPGGSGGAALGCLLSILLVWGYRSRFAGLFGS